MPLLAMFFQCHASLVHPVSILFQCLRWPCCLCGVVALTPLHARSQRLEAFAAVGGMELASPCSGRTGSDAEIPSSDEIRGRSISPEWAGPSGGADILLDPQAAKADEAIGHVFTCVHCASVAGSCAG